MSPRKHKPEYNRKDAETSPLYENVSVIFAREKKTQKSVLSNLFSSKNKPEEKGALYQGLLEKVLEKGDDLHLFIVQTIRPVILENTDTNSFIHRLRELKQQAEKEGKTFVVYNATCAENHNLRNAPDQTYGDFLNVDMK